MSQQQTGEPLVGVVRFRVPLPIVIPILSLAIIAAVTIGLSRVLLALPKEAATVIGIAMAANVLGVCAFMALRQRVSGGAFFELVAILLYPVVIGVAVAALNIGEGAGHGEEAHAPAGGGGNTVSAANVAFSVTELTLPAGETVDYTFVNEDSVEHNISIYPDAEAGVAKTGALFEGEIIQGGQETTYGLGPFESGDYYFQCDVHPNMNGPVLVE